MLLQVDKNVYVSDQGGLQVTDGRLVPLGYVQLTSLAASTPLSPHVPANTRLAIIQAEGANVRWLDTIGTPTPTFGMILYDTQDIVYVGNPSDLKFIQTSSGAKLNITFYK